MTLAYKNRNYKYIFTGCFFKDTANKNHVFLLTPLSLFLLISISPLVLSLVYRLLLLRLSSRIPTLLAFRISKRRPACERSRSWLPFRCAEPSLVSYHLYRRLTNWARVCVYLLGTGTCGSPFTFPNLTTDGKNRYFSWNNTTREQTLERCLNLALASAFFCPYD